MGHLGSILVFRYHCFYNPFFSKNIYNNYVPSKSANVLKCFWTLRNLCCWHVIRKAIWQNLEDRNLRLSSSCLCPCLAVSVLYVEKNQNKYYILFRKFVTYQIAFLMTCQQHLFHLNHALAFVLSSQTFFF